jgi:hypothetical protein
MICRSAHLFLAFIYSMCRRSFIGLAKRLAVRFSPAFAGNADYHSNREPVDALQNKKLCEILRTWTAWRVLAKKRIKTIMTTTTATATTTPSATATTTPSARVPTLDGHGLTRIQYYGLDKEVYDPDFYAAIRAEKSFREIGEREYITDLDVSRAVGLGQAACPLCGWVQGILSRRRIPLLHEGVETHVHVNMMVRCSCYLSEILHQRWSGPKSMVAERYRKTFLYTLVPTRHIIKSFAIQQRVIDCVRSGPYDSYLLCGESGTGKTTYSTALFSNALMEWAFWAFTKRAPPEGVWRIETHTLLAQHMDWNRRVDALAMNPMTGEQEIQAPKPPLVTRAKILAAREAGFRPCLFLDELDKIVLSPAKLTTLFDLLDAVYTCRGQLVVCSNMTVHDISVLLGERVGVAVVRRIKEATDVDADGTTTSSRIIDFFAENPFATSRQQLATEKSSGTPESEIQQSDTQDVEVYDGVLNRGT